MIVVFTRYDAVTSVLASYANQLLTEGGLRISYFLGPPLSTAATVRARLTASPANALLFFGHGTDLPPTLCAQDQMPVIDGGNCDLLRGRLVLATCCHSINGLASLVVPHYGTTVLGYKGELFVPIRAPYSLDMEDCVLAAPRALLRGDSAGVARQLTEANFRALARRLQSGSITDQIVSVFMDFNADAAELAGNANHVL